MKRYNKIFLSCVCLFFLLFGCLQGYAQQNEENAIENYKTEFALGLNFNTMSGLIGGVNVKLAKKIKNLQYHNLFFEFVNIKHPKEDSGTARSGETFTLGKVNYLTFLRTHYGREFILFRAEAEQGVQVNFLASAGLTTGFEIPYYVEYQDGNVLRLKQYDTSISYSSINRSSGILGEGLSNLGILFGGSAKASVAFRFNAFRNTTLGLEGGLMLDMMQRKVQMMAAGEDRQFYNTFFISLFYGSLGK
jgi:hypothetical protein